MKAIQEYLVLLSVGQTCKYQGIDLLDFIRSGKNNIDAFAHGKLLRMLKTTLVKPHGGQDRVLAINVSE